MKLSSRDAFVPATLKPRCAIDLAAACENHLMVLMVRRGSFGLVPRVIADRVADRQAVELTLVHRAVDPLAAFDVEIDQPALALPRCC
jgi:hypothetical protein